MDDLQKGSKKLIRAWASYDWANSVYFLVITSTIFPIYYGSLFGDNLYIDVFGQSLKNTALTFSKQHHFQFMFHETLKQHFVAKKSFFDFFFFEEKSAVVG